MPSAAGARPLTGFLLDLKSNLAEFALLYRHLVAHLHESGLRPAALRAWHRGVPRLQLLRRRFFAVGKWRTGHDTCCATRTLRSEEHTELQSQFHLVCRLLLEKK